MGDSSLSAYSVGGVGWGGWDGMWRGRGGGGGEGPLNASKRSQMWVADAKGGSGLALLLGTDVRISSLRLRGHLEGSVAYVILS
jgi:hypothetical protein